MYSLEYFACMNSSLTSGTACLTKLLTEFTVFSFGLIGQLAYNPIITRENSFEKVRIAIVQIQYFSEHTHVEKDLRPDMCPAPARNNQCLKTRGVLCLLSLVPPVEDFPPLALASGECEPANPQAIEANANSASSGNGEAVLGSSGGGSACATCAGSIEPVVRNATVFVSEPPQTFVAVS